MMKDEAWPFGLPSAPAPISVILLAGGRSSRLGQDKAWLPFGGEPLVLRAARRVSALAGEILFSAGPAERYAALGDALAVPARVAPDLHPGTGPLAGLEAGLAAARYDLALLLAVDMPFVSLPLLRHMICLAPGYDAVIPVVAGPGSPQSTPGTAERSCAKRLPGAGTQAPPRPPQEGGRVYEPLHALYRRSCLPAVAAHLAAGDRRMISILPDVRVRELAAEEIAPYDPDGIAFFNINTPADWQWAQEVLGRE